jgi:predicted HTH transcriptional regulator
MRFPLQAAVKPCFLLMLQAPSVFDATDDYLKVVVGKASGKAASHVGKTSGEILSAISRNPDITIPELAEVVGVTRRSVKRHLRNLQHRDALLQNPS